MAEVNGFAVVVDNDVGDQHSIVGTVGFAAAAAVAVAVAVAGEAIQYEIA